MKQKKIAIILSGCGNKDGSEITETVSLTIALSQQNADMTFFAPNKEFSPKNFMTGEALPEKRNIMIEASRISRGEMKDLKDLKAQDFDGLAFPGGYGAAIHLCDWVEKQAKCSIHPLVEKAVLDFFQASKPIAAICIAPVIIAKILGHRNVEITLGNDPGAMKEAAKTGAHLVECPATDYITDRSHKVITTPAYMLDAKPHEVFQGISGLVKEFIEMA